jgi:hypothetical protein
MRRLILVTLLLASGHGEASGPAQVRFALAVRIGDSAPVQIDAAVPVGTMHRLQATEHLTFEVSAPPIVNGTVATVVRLLDDTSGTSVELVSTSWYRPADQERSFAYTVCPGRVIFQRPIPAKLARCADLPPMATPDPIVGPCRGCQGPYEGMPTMLSSRARIAPPGEPGEPLVVTGRVFGQDGKPRSNVVVYAYHPMHAAFTPSRIRREVRSPTSRANCAAGP